jgi:3-phenylpropionate/cinnamic acid dioxygenase small subunit
MAGTDITRQDLIDFVVNEAHLLDTRRYEEWNALFTDDAFYWVPLVPDQEDGLNHTSHLYEDKLLRELRIERLKSPRAFSQQPPSRCHHLLQVPVVETFDAEANRFVVRTELPLHRVAGRRTAVLRRHLLSSPHGARRRIAHDAQAREPAQLRRGASGRAAFHLRTRCKTPPSIKSSRRPQRARRRPSSCSPNR